MAQYIYKPVIVPNRPGYDIEKFLWEPTWQNRGIGFTSLGIVKTNVPDSELISVLEVLSSE